MRNIKDLSNKKPDKVIKIVSIEKKIVKSKVYQIITYDDGTQQKISDTTINVCGGSANCTPFIPQPHKPFRKRR